MPQSKNGESQQGKGGGPKTKAGKAKVSRNAVKHGIYSVHPVIIEGLETVEDWEDYRDAITECLEPIGAYEEDLAESIALTRWRLRRVTHAETAEINMQVHRTADDLGLADAYANSITKEYEETPEPDPRRIFAHQQPRVVPHGEAADRLMRQEAHLHRIWRQTAHELEAVQARRQGQPSSLHRFDFSSSPAQVGSTSRPKLPASL